jgi:beta-lactamase superfamily II metal-dependent hydrolase
MNYNGFEIDMLSVGDADCILVTEWADSIPTRVLIDGGNTQSAKTLKAFLGAHEVGYLDHVVCTHPHDDHACGLVELVKDETIGIGTAWVHRPELHIDLLEVELAISRSHGLKRAKIIQETLETASNLVALCEQRGIQVDEPFAGKKIGCLTVVGPSEHYYTELLAQFADSSEIQASERLLRQCTIQEIAEGILEAQGQAGVDLLLDDPETQPENNSSVILATIQQGGKYLFTGDAGAHALTLAAAAFDLTNCRWMQIPHHGSRRNITKGLIETFSPKIAYVSASGNKKHPRRAVVNAFKENGATVYSTHYPSSGSKWHHRGDVPDRPSYSSATALWEARK